MNYRHFKGIVEYYPSQLTNDILEGINSKVLPQKGQLNDFDTKKISNINFSFFGIIHLKYSTT